MHRVEKKLIWVRNVPWRRGWEVLLVANVGCGEGGNEIRRSKSGHVARRNGIVHFSFPKSAPKEPFKTPFPPTHVFLRVQL